MFNTDASVGLIKAADTIEHDSQLLATLSKWHVLANLIFKERMKIKFSDVLKSYRSNRLTSWTNGGRFDWSGSSWSGSKYVY